MSLSEACGPHFKASLLSMLLHSPPAACRHRRGETRGPSGLEGKMRKMEKKRRLMLENCPEEGRGNTKEEDG